MGSLTIRKIPFDFEGVDFLWNPANPAWSAQVNDLSFSAIAFERVLCKAFRLAEALIDDPVIAEECRLFVEQEAAHSAAHHKHVSALIARYPGLKETRDKAIAYFDQILEEHGLEFTICFGAVLEGTFTPMGKLIIDNRELLFADGDARVASVWLWHFSEEIEHRSSALTIYNHLYGHRFARLRMLPWIRRFILGYSELMQSQIATHVPAKDKGIVDRKSFDDLPRDEYRLALWRTFLSLLPWHDPATEPLPEWAQAIYDRYDEGKDLTQFYGRKVEDSLSKDGND